LINFSFSTIISLPSAFNPMMKSYLVIDNLLYEELVLLQQILVDINEKKVHHEYDAEIFSSLYEKVMVA